MPSRPAPRPVAGRGATQVVALALAVVLGFGVGACSGDTPRLRSGPPVTTGTLPAPGGAASTVSTGPTPSIGTASTAVTVPVASTTKVATTRVGVPGVKVYDESAGAAVRTTLASPDPDTQQVQVFVVLQERAERLQVQLPVRPNNSTGWIDRSDVVVTQHDYRIEVSLGAHRFQVFEGARRLVDVPAAIGTTDGPTAGGTAYIWALVEPSRSGTGSYAYRLSSFTDADGGTSTGSVTAGSGDVGRLSINGTLDPGATGGDVADGCVRITEAEITRLVRELRLPLGVPVTVNR